jgi:hypothetical protein
MSPRKSSYHWHDESIVVISVLSDEIDSSRCKHSHLWVITTEFTSKTSHSLAKATLHVRCLTH